VAAMIVTAPRPCVATGPLTDRGLMVAYSVRLRNAAEQLDDVTRQRLLDDLRELVQTYCPRTPRPVA
jgi:hypothetical protein